MNEIIAEARFQLAEDRVRNLLMGEALYKDTSLAIRELYQNAVDATRHAAARIEWLNRTSALSSQPDVSSCRRQDLPHDPRTTTGDQFTPIVVDHMFTHATEDHLNQVTQNYFVRMTTPYAGDVDLTQDTEGAGEYIDCTDNGVGMGLREITGVFAQAGMRSADSPDFVAELADYARLDPPIDLWTNSRFGIGALSYFMLADRIEITTTRLHRDGTLGPTFHVDITGPETCFRITQINQAPSHGTTVRLWLREPGTVSALSVLRTKLIVAPVSVHVREPRTGGEITWKPDQLNSDCVPDPARRVWWIAAINGYGSLLSDGLMCDSRARAVGAHVDLRGTHAPKLAVDRNEILDYDKDYVQRTLIASVDTLVRDASQDQLERISRSILDRRGEGTEAVADAVSDGLSRRGTVMGTLQDCQTNLARSGHVDKVPTWADDWVASAQGLGDPKPHLNPGPSWDRVVRPRPSDSVLLSGWEDMFDILGEDPTIGDWPLPVLGLSAAYLGRRPDEVRARYAELGFRFPSWRSDLRWDEIVAQILANPNVYQRSRWYSTTSLPVAEMAMAQLAIHHDLGIREVAGILDEWGIPHESLLLFADRGPTMVEECFFYRGRYDYRGQPHSSTSMWLHRGSRLSANDLINIAAYLHQGLREAAQTGRDLGFDVPTPLIDSLTDLHQSLQYIDSKWDVLMTAYQKNQSPSRMLQLANDLGFGFQEDFHLDTAPDVADFEQPNDSGGPLHRLAVLIVHQASSTPVDEVTAAFEWAGFTLAGPDLDDTDSLDLSLVTYTTIDDSSSILDVAQPLNPYWVMIQAQRRKLSAAEVLRRYIRLGFTVTSPECVIEPTANLLLLVSKLGKTPDPDDPLMDPGSRVTASRVLLAVRQTRLSIDEILTMYTSLGLHPEDPRTVLPVLRPGPIPPSQ